MFFWVKNIDGAAAGTLLLLLVSYVLIKSNIFCNNDNSILIITIEKKVKVMLHRGHMTHHIPSTCDPSSVTFQNVYTYIRIYNH